MGAGKLFAGFAELGKQLLLPEQRTLALGAIPLDPTSDSTAGIVLIVCGPHYLLYELRGNEVREPSGNKGGGALGIGGRKSPRDRGNESPGVGGNTRGG